MTINNISGDYTGGGRFGIVAARFNRFVTDRLVEGAVDTLVRHGVETDGIDCAWVPGAFEIPLVARKMAETGRYRAVITLGAVIRGATPHFDYVAGHCAGGIARLAGECDVPVVFGVLTTDTVDQAIERAGSKAGNKGSDAALAALEMSSVLEKIQGQS